MLSVIKFRNFLEEEDGIGTVEVLLILVENSPHPIRL